MAGFPHLQQTTKLLADHSRLEILTLLMDGRFHTVHELAKKAKIKRQILKRISIFADGKFEDGGVKYNKWTAWLVQSGRVASRCSGAGRSERADTVDRGSCVWRVLTI